MRPDAVAASLPIVNRTGPNHTVALRLSDMQRFYLGITFLGVTVLGFAALVALGKILSQ
jgi:hypothetical protein